MDFSITVSSFDMLKGKMELADLAVSAGEKWMGELASSVDFREELQS